MVYLRDENYDYFYNGEKGVYGVESISFLDNMKVPKEAKDAVWDASLNKDGSVEVKTYSFNDETGLYEETKIETKYIDGFTITKNNDGSTDVNWPNTLQEKYNKIIRYIKRKWICSNSTY